jgi:hypothetical protein
MGGRPEQIIMYDLARQCIPEVLSRSEVNKGDFHLHFPQGFIPHAF